MKFKDKLKSLGFHSYDDYLRSNHWWNFKQAWKDSGQRMTCDVCNKSVIDLHHVTYQRLGDELFGDVIPVCRQHHKDIHEWLKANDKYIGSTPRAINILRMRLIADSQVVAPRNNRNPKKKPKAVRTTPKPSRKVWMCPKCHATVACQGKAERKAAARMHGCTPEQTIKILANVEASKRFKAEHEKAVKARKLSDRPTGVDVNLRMIAAGLRRQSSWCNRAMSKR